MTMPEILMPRLADAMEQGTIVKWLVADGDEIAVGDEVCEIETDKATMPYAAEVEGTVNIVVSEGETVAVGDVIARVGADASGGKDAASPASGQASPEPVASSATMTAVKSPPSTRDSNGQGATPLARRIAAAHDVSLDSVSGSGPRGRITKADVLAAAGLEVARPAAPEPASPAAPATVATIGGRVQQLTRVQQIVAERMAAAKATVPHFQVQTEVEMDAALALRAELKAVAEGAPPPSVNDLLVRACALALRDHPLVNGSFANGAYELHDDVHIGIAVAAEGGLLVATIRDADKKSLGTLAGESRDLAERVRAGRATPAELTGATFTVSNLGMYGMTAITPVINPPQAAILGVGTTRSILARVDGEIVDRHVMTLTLSCDHRIVNGADASRFLADVKRLLEVPLRLTL
jgi:pyruvate dehydrogenase E2 component (dihydrolipoamide acetyltransferase)